MRLKTKNKMLAILDEIRRKVRRAGARGERRLFTDIRQQIAMLHHVADEGLTQREREAYDGIFIGIEQALDALPQVPEAGVMQETAELLGGLVQYLMGKVQAARTKKLIVFLPYKAAMWDSLESIWMAADRDREHCQAMVIPIPYADRNPDGTAARWHYEIDQFPKYVPVVHHETVDLAELHPDAIFIHNPYDDHNVVTSVDMKYYSDRLKHYTEDLVYVPYFVTGKTVQEHFCQVPGVVNADHVIVQDENIKEQYEKYYPGGHPPKGKFLALGSPKFDKVRSAKRSDYHLPPDWQRIVEGKKVVLYNTGLTAMLRNADVFCEKIRSVFRAFRARKDVALWWRPHPLLAATFESMHPERYAEYQQLVQDYKTARWGIYDDTSDLDRAIACTDAYYGDGSSLVQLYEATGKPIIFQSYEPWERREEPSVPPDLDFIAVLPKDDVLYFPGWKTSGWFRYDKKTKTTRVLKMFSAWTDSFLYHGLMEMDGKLYFLPTNAWDIRVYDLLEKTWKTIPIEEPYRKMTPIFQTTRRVGNELWLIPYHSNAILRLDTTTNQTTYYDAWSADTHWERKIGVGGGDLFQGTIYFPVLQTEDIVAFDVKTQQHTIHHVALEPEEKIFAMVAGAQGLWCYTSHDRLFCWHPERGILQMLTDALGEPSAYGAAMICCLGKLWAFRFETDRCVAVDETTGVLQRYDGYAPEEAKDKIGFPSPRFRDGNIYLLPNRSAGLLIFHPETGKASCFRIPNAPDYQARHRKVYASKRPFYQSEQNMICDIATFASWMGDQEAEETASEGTACGEKIYQCVVK